ncbi:hypothetical protein DIS15_00805 [Levilactobacillus brevis]|uniref:helix-turn-helix domain-containing protein n=1 Tax=Levilactobacillus brevis TaxID=1580 RepID=UPI00111FC115|nr:helix-turn-helix transcriptional regulator [Levilactobacillus brevis]TOY86019.1 hypothetical protein DIS15_00805 [Levilactobacillus brevis]
MNNLGENIKKGRTHRGLSQKEASLKLNVSRQSISKWENNKVSPDVNNIIKLSIVYNMSVEELIFGKTNLHSPKDNNTTTCIFKKAFIHIAIFIFSLTLSALLTSL